MDLSGRVACGTKTPIAGLRSVSWGHVYQGPQPHIRASNTGADVVTKVKVSVKQTAAAEVFTSAAEIVDRVIRENGLATNTQPCPALPNPQYLARQANRYRQQMRPMEPRDLNFELLNAHQHVGQESSQRRHDAVEHSSGRVSMEFGYRSITDNV